MPLLYLFHIIFSYPSYLIGGGIKPAMVLDLKLTPPAYFIQLVMVHIVFKQLYTNSIDIHVADCMQIIWIACMQAMLNLKKKYFGTV